MKIVFWNTHRNKTINKYILDLVEENNCDIIILAEYQDDGENLKNELYIRGYDFEKCVVVGCNKIDTFHRKDISMELNNDNSNYVSYRVKWNILDIELFAVHFPSKLYSSDDTRQLVSRILKADIDDKNNALIVGDFNSNPFEKTMIASSCLSALPTKKCNTRIVQGETIKNLYNPMWKFFDDFEKIPGTYFYNNSDDINYFWNVFDQVIISKDLVNKFHSDDVVIVKKIKKKNLIKNGKIDKNISDHLPLSFVLKEENNE